MKLGIGTVQFGVPYGIANRGGTTSQREIASILAVAAEAGIEHLDTAPAYGDSESRLGVALQEGGMFRIVTKTPVLGVDQILPAHAAILRSTFLQSLENLRQEQVSALLVHRVADVTAPGGHLLIDAMQQLVREGLVENIGVSVYTGEQIDKVLRLFHPDIVQLPLNVLDQRLLRSGHLDQLKRQQVEIHARSVFLQGLLLLEPQSIPSFFSPIKRTLEDYAGLLAAHKMTRLKGALDFISQIEAIDCVIIGVNRARELREILEQARVLPEESLDFARFAIADENMVLPSRWKL